MKKNKINIILFTLFIITIVFACDGTGPIEAIIPEKNVSYSIDIQPLLNTRCNNTGCHNSEDRAGSISLTSYGDLFATPFLVIPESPDESYLYLAVAGKLMNVMPPPYGSVKPLNDNQINGIKTWILEGAKAN